MDDVDPAEPQPTEPGEQVRLSEDELLDLFGLERMLHATDPRFVTSFEARIRRGRTRRRWHPFRR